MPTTPETSADPIAAVVESPQWAGLSREQRARARVKLFTGWLEANPEKKDAFLEADEAQRGALFGEFATRVTEKFPAAFATETAEPDPVRVAERERKLAAARQAKADWEAAAAKYGGRLAARPYRGDERIAALEAERVPGIAVPILDPESERKLAAVTEAQRTKRGTGFEAWTAEDFGRLGPWVDMLAPGHAGRSVARSRVETRALELGFPGETPRETEGRQMLEGALAPVIKAADKVFGRSERELQQRALAQSYNWAQGDAGLEAAGAVGALAAGGGGVARALGRRLLTKGGVGIMAGADALLGAAYADKAPGLLAHAVEQWEGEANATRDAILTGLEAAGISALAGLGVRQLTIRQLKERARAMGWRGATNADLRDWYREQVAARAPQAAEAAKTSSAPVAAPGGPTEGSIRGAGVSPPENPTGPAAAGAVDSPPAGAEEQFLARAGVKREAPVTAGERGAYAAAAGAQAPAAAVSAEVAELADTGPPVDVRAAWERPFDPMDPKAVIAKWGEGVDVPFAHLAEVRPLETPELVSLFRGLTGGAVPKVMKLPKAAGLFAPVGRGAMKLDYRIFQNPAMVARVLAHEIGHLVDYLPEQTMKRGNVLGRFASLQNYLRTTLDLHRVVPSRALTPADRAAMRKQAYAATRAELGGRPSKEESEVDYAEWGAEWSRKYHELVEEEIETRKLTKADLVREELIALTDWWKPYLEAAEAGSVPESYVAYRESGEELFAEFVSVLFNAPGELARRAPTAWRLFWNHVNAKPEVSRAILEMQELVGGSSWMDSDPFRPRSQADPVAAKFARRRAERLAGYDQAERVFLRKLEEQAAARTSFAGWKNQLRQQLLDRFDPVVRPATRIMQDPKADPAMRTFAQQIDALFDEHPLAADALNTAMLMEFHEKVFKAAERAGFSINDVGELLELRRIANERIELPGEERGGRANLANPGGESPDTAEAAIAARIQELGPGRFAELDALAKAFQEIAWPPVEAAWREGLISDEMMEVLRANRGNYVTFRTVDHIQTFVPAGIIKQRGTLQRIENPVVATILKLMAMNKATQLNRAKRAAVSWQQTAFPASIRPAELRGGGKEARPVEPEEPDMALLEVMEKGARSWWVVPEDVAAMFNQVLPAWLDAGLRVVNLAWKYTLYPLIITFNPGFALWSAPVRDARRSWRNVPGGRGARTGAALARNVPVLAVEALNAATRGLRRFGLREIPVPDSIAGRAVRDYLTGQPNPLIQEMLLNSAIGSPIDAFQSGGHAGSESFAAMLRKASLLPDANRHAWFKARVLRPLAAPFRGIEWAGLTNEYISKVETYYDLTRGKKWEPRDAAMFVRRHVGLPHRRREGLHARLYGAIFPFVNIFIQGYRDDLRLARGRQSAAGWWLRWGLGSGGLRMLAAAGAAGWLGHEIKEYYDHVSEYQKTNKLVVPVGWSDGGEVTGKRVVAFAIPEDETDRLLGGVLHKVIGQLSGDNAEAYRQVLDFGGTNLPSVNPLIEIPAVWGAVAAGLNPPAGHRGGQLLTRDEERAGPRYQVRPTVEWTLRQTGAMSFFTYDRQADSTFELVVGGAPVLNRMMLVTDYGARERVRAADDAQERMRAQVRLNMPQDVQALKAELNFLEAIPVENLTLPQTTRRLELQSWRAKVYSPAEEGILMGREMGLQGAESFWHGQLQRESEAFKRR